MFNLRKHLSPSTVIATAALLAATGGTALAAGEIITAPNQVAADVLTGGHLKQESISNLDLKEPQLKLRVAKDGTRLGAGDGTPTRIGIGAYEVTFNPAILNGADGSTTDTVLNENCAINATAHGGLRQLFVNGPTPLRPNTVTVNVGGLRNTGGSAGFFAEDSAFDITASC